jgi:nucleotide-binding universal stress UspA family protein
MRGNIMKIMVCYDGSEVSKDAVRLAGEHAKVFSGKVYLIGSMKGGMGVPRGDFEVREDDLEKQKTVLREAGVDCQASLLVRGLDAGEDLVEYAAENQMDEIIIGVRRRSKVGKLLFGSTAQYVILEAPCPVITVR